MSGLVTARLRQGVEMSDTSKGDGWWLANDGKWYAPELHSEYPPPPPPPPGPPAAVGPITDPNPEASIPPDESLARPETSTGEALPPGWWQDARGTWHAPADPRGMPLAGAGQRDGRPSSTEAVGQSNPPTNHKTPYYKRWWAWAAAAVVLIAVIGAATGGNSSKKPNTTSVALVRGSSATLAPATTTTTPPPTTTIAPPPTTTTTTTSQPPPPTTTTVPPAPVGPTLTQQQQSAVEEANQYLSTEAFSQQGLIDQLDSPDGGGYSVNDATVAVDSLTVNWNAEAVQAAKEYLQTQPFSCNDLIQQLDSPDGGEFTVAQATYGATQAGDC